jgi:hypothetical protein
MQDLGKFFFGGGEARVIREQGVTVDRVEWETCGTLNGWVGWKVGEMRAQEDS